MSIQAILGNQFSQVLIVIVKISENQSKVLRRRKKFSATYFLSKVHEIAGHFVWKFERPIDIYFHPHPHPQGPSLSPFALALL